jgi:hypothetical protein
VQLRAPAPRPSRPHPTPTSPEADLHPTAALPTAPRPPPSLAPRPPPPLAAAPQPRRQTSTFGSPTSARHAQAVRLSEDTVTLSKSTSRSRPTPARASMLVAWLPTPPRPTTTTKALRIARCPVGPKKDSFCDSCSSAPRPAPAQRAPRRRTAVGGAPRSVAASGSTAAEAAAGPRRWRPGAPVLALPANLARAGPLRRAAELVGPAGGACPRGGQVVPGWSRRTGQQMRSSWAFSAACCSCATCDNRPFFLLLPPPFQCTGLAFPPPFRPPSGGTGRGWPGSSCTRSPAR